MELIAVDGTKLKASNHLSHQRSAEQIKDLLAEVEARIEEYLAALDQKDAQGDLLGHPLEPEVPGQMARKLAALRQCRERYQEALEVAQATGEKAPVIDPQCQSMQKVGLGYNAQIAVDAQHHLIVAAEILTDRSRAVTDDRRGGTHGLGSQATQSSGGRGLS